MVVFRASSNPSNLWRSVRELIIISAVGDSTETFSDSVRADLTMFKIGHTNSNLPRVHTNQITFFTHNTTVSLANHPLIILPNSFFHWIDMNSQIWSMNELIIKEVDNHPKNTNDCAILAEKKTEERTNTEQTRRQEERKKISSHKSLCVFVGLSPSSRTRTFPRFRVLIPPRLCRPLFCTPERTKRVFF